MGSGEQQNDAKLLTNYRTAIVAGGLAALGVVLLLVAGLSSWFNDLPALRSILDELGGLLFVTGGLTVFWELRGRRDLIDEVLAKANIASDVKASGLTGVSMDWNATPWATYIREAREITVFIAYGSSWRKLYWVPLSEFAAKKGNSIRVILPDPDDGPTVGILAQRFDYTPEKTADLIREMAQEMAKLHRTDGADIRIYYRAGDPTYTLYRFDDKYVITLYANRRARGDVPAFLLGEGSLQTFFAEDLDAIVRQSRAVPLEDLKN